MNVCYSIYFPGIPSIASRTERVKQALADRLLFQTPRGTTLAQRAAAVLSHRLAKPITADLLANPDRVTNLAPNALDPYEHVRHLTRNAISYCHIQHALTGRLAGLDTAPVLLCGRSMGILAAMVVAECVTFEDGVYIAAQMASFHTESYYQADAIYISRKLYKLHDALLQELLFMFYCEDKYIKHPLFILEHDHERHTLIQYPETDHEYLEKCLEKLNISSSRFSYFPSGAHTPLTRGRIGDFSNILKHEVTIKSPRYPMMIHSQSERNLHKILNDPEDISKELIEVMSGPMDMKPLFELLTQLAYRDNCFMVIEIGSTDLETVLSLQEHHLRANFVQFHNPYSPTYHWLDTFIDCLDTKQGLPEV